MTILSLAMTECTDRRMLGGEKQTRGCEIMQTAQPLEFGLFLKTVVTECALSLHSIPTKLNSCNSTERRNDSVHTANPLNSR